MEEIDYNMPETRNMCTIKNQHKNGIVLGDLKRSR